MTAVRCVFDRVAEHVEHDLLHAPAVAEDEREIFGIVVRQLMTVAARLQLDGPQDCVDGGGKGKTRHIHFAAAGIEPRKREQILHNVGHAVSFADDDIEKVILRFTAEVAARFADGFGIGAHVGQRRAQLVGNVGNEFLTPLFRFLLFGHIVQHDENAAAFLV